MTSRAPAADPVPFAIHESSPASDRFSAVRRAGVRSANNNRGEGRQQSGAHATAREERWCILKRVRPADRIPIIKRCAERLANETWPEIDFVLSQFNLPTQESWATDDKHGYVVEMLNRCRDNFDDELVELDAYLGGDADVDRAEEPWSDGSTFRVFLSHVASERSYAAEVKLAMRQFGIEAFVAHEDIEPGAEWLRTILAALHSCDALVALLHREFPTSRWCDQETGIALGRGVTTVPVKIDIDPYGFLGGIQAVYGADHNASSAVRAVVDILIKDKKTGTAMTEAVVSALVNAWSFNQANTLAQLLRDAPQRVTWEQMDRLRLAQQENVDVREAWHVAGALARLESALPKRRTPEPPPPFDEEPF